MGFLVSSSGKESACSAGDLSSIPEWKISWRKGGLHTPVFMGFLGDSDDKESACSVGDLGLTPGLRRSFGEGHGYPVQYSLLGEFYGQRSLTGYYPWDH